MLRGLTCTVLLSLGLLVYPQAGSLDSTFAGDGMLIFPVGVDTDEASAICMQTDGKILLAGFSVDTISFNLIVSMSRVMSNGTLDGDFGNNGRVLTPVMSTSAEIESVAVQSDGKILLAGSLVMADRKFLLMRYNGDGTIDSTFGSAGIVVTDLQTEEHGYALALGSNGRILMAGYTRNLFEDYDLALLQYLPTGAPDLSFGTNGSAVTDVSGGDDHAYALAVLPNGKILVVGESDDNVLVTQYEPNGLVDSTFATNGALITSWTPMRDNARSIDLQADGKIVVAGAAGAGTWYADFGVMRINVDGSLDTTFDGDGFTITGFSAYGDYPVGVRVTTDGRIVAGGKAELTAHFALACYLPNGTLDPGFGNNGQVLAPLGGLEDHACAMTLDQQDRVVLAGASRVTIPGTGTDHDYAVARFLTTSLLGMPTSSMDPGYRRPFPNPTSGVLHVDNGGSTAGLGRFIDVQGRLIEVPVARHESSLEFDLTHVPDGLYFLSVGSDPTTSTYRIIKLGGSP